MTKWKDLKKKGNPSYKGKLVEPIDLFKEGEILWDWCIGEIIAKAYRNREIQTWDMTGDGIYIVTDPTQVKKDLDEIIHHAEMIKALVEETEKD